MSMNPQQMQMMVRQTMSSPLGRVLVCAQQGNNPMQMIQQMARQSPAGRLIVGKDARQLERTAINMAKERGIDLAQYAGMMGLRLPK